MEVLQILGWVVWLVFCFYAGTRLEAYLRR